MPLGKFAEGFLASLIWLILIKPYSIPLKLKISEILVDFPLSI